MSENIRVVVTGVSGRMGQMILAGVCSNTKTRLVGAIEREGHDWIGKDVGMVSDSTTLGIEVSADPASVFKDADAILNTPITKIIFEGPEDKLNLTENTQPAIFLASYCIFEIIKKEFGYDFKKFEYFFISTGSGFLLFPTRE